MPELLDKGWIDDLWTGNAPLDNNFRKRWAGDYVLIPSYESTGVVKSCACGVCTLVWKEAPDQDAERERNQSV